jgi:hypothetical protein
MKTNKILTKNNVRFVYTLLFFVFTTSLFSCTSEQFVDAKNIQIWNYDSIPMDIYVDGEKAVSFDKRKYGDVYLTSGSYELVAKVGDKEIDRIEVSVSKKTEGNRYDKQIWTVGQKRNYALFNAGELYEGDGEIELIEKFMDVNLIEFDCPTYRFYYPNNKLPMSLYTSGNPDVYQLIEIPEAYIGKEDLDERLLKYMDLRAAF